MLIMGLPPFTSFILNLLVPTWSGTAFHNEDIGANVIYLHDPYRTVRIGEFIFAYSPNCCMAVMRLI